MNKFPLARRFNPRPPVVGPAEARSPFRLWMTGSLAVVMAALVPLRESSTGLQQGGIRMLRHSRFGVEETVARIEHAAVGQGLSVLARMGGDRPVIVLASSVGGTLVVMDEPDSAPAVPLSLFVRADGHGGADVLGLASAADRSAWVQLPDAVLRDVAGLPTLVERALG